MRSLLLLRGASTDVALDAADVGRVTPRAEWGGGQPVDAMRHFGLEPGAGAEPSVVEVRGAPPLLALGPLAIVSVAPEDVLALPPQFTGPVQAVVLSGARPVLVLRPASLIALAGAAA